MKSLWRKNWREAREIADNYMFRKAIQYFDRNNEELRVWQPRVDRASRDAYFAGLRDGYKWAETDTTEEAKGE